MKVLAKYAAMLLAGAGLAISASPALPDSNPSPQQVLEDLAGVATPDGVLVRKMMAPISFAMGPIGGADPKYAQDVTFFRALQSEVSDFLEETLKSRYSADADSRAIRVVVLFPDFKGSGDEASLDKLFSYGDSVVREGSQGGYYLMECRNLVQNLQDPYNKQEPPADQWSVEMAGSLDIELTVRGTNYDKDELTRCLYRHVLAGLGLRGEIAMGHQSVLAKDNPAVRPTGFDRWLVETLYEWDGPAGAEFRDAFSAASFPTP